MSRILRGLLPIAVLPLVADCGNVEVPENSQTHWLKQCDSDADCDSLSCICHYCVEPCNADGTCLSDGTTCVSAESTQIAGSLCGGAPVEQDICLSTCSDSKPCGEAEACVEGSCVPAAVFPDAAPDSEWGRGSPLAGATSTKQLDLLFVVDNSISMADKQQVLKLAVPDLVVQLANRGVDMRIGVITTSVAIGPSGATDIYCYDSVEQKNDAAHLLATLPRAAALGITDGYLSWKPGDDVDQFTQTLQNLVVLAGEQGCGYEAPLEAWYRFLVDPEPPLTFQEVPCSPDNANPCMAASGVDNELLHQRAAFLRPGSALAVVMLTDGDDCSIRMTEQNYYMARNDLRMWRPSSACASNPNDPCCYSCGAANPPQGCSADPICDANRYLTQDEDSPNLRCFDQKRRFGISMLYPIERYHAALTNREIAKYDGQFAPNPLYSSVPDARGPSLVFLAGALGVPWQDLVSEQDVHNTSGDLRFLSAAELSDTARWDVILGSPEASPPVPPSDSLMVPSVEPRGGSTFTGAPLAGITAGYLANPINGHEWNASMNNDLQYACIFPLPEEQIRDCSTVSPDAGCDCFQDYISAMHMNPVCQDASGAYSTVQRFAKAQPSTRELDLLKRLGNQAIVGSVCTPNMIDHNRADYGYRPVVNGLLERLAPVLQ